MNEIHQIERMHRMELIGNGILKEFKKKEISVPDGIGAILIILAKQVVCKNADKKHLLLAFDEMIRLLALTEEE